MTDKGYFFKTITKFLLITAGNFIVWLLPLLNMHIFVSPVYLHHHFLGSNRESVGF